MQKVLSLCFAFSMLLTSGSALGQQYPIATGSYAYGTFQNKGFDTINVGNLNVHFSIPVLNKSGRGLPFYYNLAYDSSVWSPSASGGSGVWQPAQGFGWKGDTDSELATGYMTFSSSTVIGRVRGSGDIFYTCPTTYYDNFVYHDTFGVAHGFGAMTINTSAQPAMCDPPASQSTATSEATDGSGYTLNITGWTGSSITTPSGEVIKPSYSTGGSGTITDSNGNEISTNGQGHFVDTTGNTVLTIAGAAPNPETFTYTDTSGASRSVTVNYSQYTVQTNFGCSGIGEYGPTTTSLVSSITLPDGSSYQFTYEPTPGYSGSVTGRLASVTLPTGGTISYAYKGANDGIDCTDGSTIGLTRTITSPSGASWNYTRSITGTGTSTTTVTDGLNNQSVYSFIEASNQPIGVAAEYYETGRAVYSGSVGGTPLLETWTCYNYEPQQSAESSPCSSSSLTLPITEISHYQRYNGQQERGTSDFYNQYGLDTEHNQYDFGGASARGALLQYQWWNYPSSGIVNEVQLAGVTSVYNGTAYTQSQTAYAYDQTTPVASSGVPQHVSLSGPHGNLTSETQYASGSLAYTTTYTHEDTGSPLSVSSPTTSSGAETTYNYDSAYEHVTGETLPTPSSGVSMSSSASFDESYTGLPLSSTDLNGQPTRVISYDEMLRPTEIDFPDGGKTLYSYATGGGQTEIKRLMAGSTYADTKTTLDGYGRTSVVAVQMDASDWDEVTYCYDANGNLSFKSYPALNQTGCSLPGDTYAYDALGRVTKITHADDTYQTFSYNGRATEWTNEAGNITRISQVDGLGRTADVCEVYSGSALLDSGSPASCGLDISGTGYLTTYAYSNDTTTITQGDQTRIFQTDWLGRPIEVVEPESGTTTYSYSLNATGLVVTRTRPAANQTNASVTTTTTTQYDALGRVVSISYSDGTPAKRFTYDTSVNWENFSQSNIKGRLSNVSASTSLNGAGSSFSYDAMGRITGLAECLPSGCGTGADDKHLSYTYDLVGNLLSAGDGAGVTTSYSYTTGAQVNEITSSLSDSTHPGTLLSSMSYGAFGPTSWQLGNGLTAVKIYDTLGRTDGGWLCNGSSQSYCTGGTQLYGYTASWRGDQSLWKCDTALAQCVNVGYDELGRLTSQTVSSGTAQNFSYIYDRWGNRWQQNVTAGSGPSPSLTFNPKNNQITTSGYTYDAAGNMTSDGIHTYTYDANGNVIEVDGGNTATYTYDALNQRVRVDTPGSDSIEYVYNVNGQRVSIWDGSDGHQFQGQAYWGSMPIEFYAGGTAHFQTQDSEGTERLQTSYNGNVEGTYTSLPYGDGYSASGTDDDAYHFAALDQDNSANEHALYREYSNMAGRWMSPDPYSGSYNLSNPQSMNRYAYVMNNPLAFIDPLGLQNTKVAASAGPGSCNGTPNGGTTEDADGAVYICQNGTLYPDNPQTVYAGDGDGDGGFTSTAPCGGLGSPCSILGAGNTVGGNATNKGYWSTFWETFSFKDLLKSDWNCYANVAWPVLKNDLNPIPSGGISGWIGATQNTADQMSQSSMMAAGAYSVSKGLTVPLRSSVVRAGMANAETFGKVSGVLGLIGFDYALGDAAYAEYKGCQ